MFNLYLMVSGYPANVDVRKKIITVIGALSVLVLGSLYTVAQADESEFFSTETPILLVLTHPDADEETGRHKIPAALGETVLDQPLAAQQQWRFLPGTSFPPRQRPSREFWVDLYQGTGSMRRLLSSIKIKYFRNRRGRWQSHFQLDLDSQLFPIRKRQLVNDGVSASVLNFMSNSGLPNGEGYYPYLDLRFRGEPTAIDSWVVRTSP